MVHSALKRKHYSGDFTQSASSLTDFPNGSPTECNALNLHCNPTRQTSSIQTLPRTPPPHESSSPPPAPLPHQSSYDPRASIRLLLELMTPSEFTKLLRARVKHILAQWPPPSLNSTSHGLPSPTSSSSSISCKPTDTHDAPDLCPGTLQAFVSFFRFEDMSASRPFTIQELHKHLAGLHSLLSFLTSMEIRSIVMARLDAAETERDRWAHIQGVLDVLRSTGTDFEDPRLLRAVASGSVRRVEVGVNTDSPVHTLGKQSALERSPTSHSSSSSQRSRGQLKVERSRKKAKTIVLSRKYPKTMTASPFFTPRSISTSFNNVIDTSASHSHSIAHPAPGASSETSGNGLVSRERQPDKLISPGCSLTNSPGSLSNADGRPSNPQPAQSIVHNEDASTTHTGQEATRIRPLSRPEDTPANHALDGCKQVSLSIRHDALAPESSNVISKSSLISSWTPSPPSTPPRNSASLQIDVPYKCATPNSDKPVALVIDQPSRAGEDMFENVDMDLSDDAANDMPEGDFRSGDQALDHIIRNTAQIGCQDSSMDVTGAEFASSVDSSVTLATATAKSSQASLISDSPEGPKALVSGFLLTPQTDTINRPEPTCEAAGNTSGLTGPPTAKKRRSRASPPRPRVKAIARDSTTAQFLSPSSVSPPGISTTSPPLEGSALLSRRPTPTFVPAQLTLSSSASNRDSDPGSSTIRLGVPASLTLEIKKELLPDESSLASGPDSKRDNNLLDSESSVALQRSNIDSTLTISSDANASEIPLQNTTSHGPHSTRHTESRHPFAKSNIEATSRPAAFHKKVGVRTGRGPPFGHKSLSDTRPPFPTGKPRLSGPNMISIPSAPRAMASVMPAMRSIFFAPTGPPVTTSPARPPSILRPEGPELPILPSDNLSVRPPTPENATVRKECLFAMQEQKPIQKRNYKRLRKSSSASSRRRSLSRSTSSRSSRSHSRSHSPPNKGSRGRKKHRHHRLPRRRSVSHSVSARTGGHSSRSRSPPIVVAKRYRLKRSRSRSPSPPSQSSTYRRRNYSYSRPSSPSPSGHRDAPVAQAPTRRRWSPDSDRQSRGHRINKDRSTPQSRRIPLHDHWSPDGDVRRRHSSRSRWTSEESVDEAKDKPLVDAETLAQPMNPEHGRRKTANDPISSSLGRFRRG